MIDRSKTTRLPAASVAVIPAKTNHFSWTSEETVVQVHGIGPLDYFPVTKSPPK